VINWVRFSGVIAPNLKVETPDPMPMINKKREMEMIKTIEQVLDDLGKLDPVAIKDLLLAGGYKGYKRAARECPLARYLSDQGFGPIMTTLHTAWTTTDDAKYWLLPDSCSLFVRRFDDGEWPELDLEAEVRS
jgi:hypothetical protein